MTVANDFLTLRSAYREAAGSDASLTKKAKGHLAAASDALTLALLTLGGDDVNRGGKARRVEQARAFLVEAVTSLSRARVYVPGIKTHALPVVMTSESSADAELHRLHQIATRLLWQNHEHLPARLQAKPLAPEEEAQLALVLHSLARNAKIERVLRYRWAGASLALAVLGPVVGLPWVGALAATFVVGLALTRLLRDTSSDED